MAEALKIQTPDDDNQQQHDEYFGQAGEKIEGFSPNVPNPEFFEQSRMLLTFIAANLDMPLMLFLMDATRGFGSRDVTPYDAFAFDAITQRDERNVAGVIGEIGDRTPRRKTMTRSADVS